MKLRIFSLLILLLAILPLHSIEKEVLKKNIAENRHLSELMLDEEYARRQKELKEKARKARDAATEKYDEVLDVKYHLESYWLLESELLTVELFGKSGTFNIYYKDPEGIRKALFAIPDLSSSTGFLLNFNDEIFRLSQSNRIKKELRRLEKGAQLVYTLDGSFRFVLDFSLISRGEKAPEDVVRLRMYTINLSQKSEQIAYKAVFDTVCGEVSSVHFSSWAGTKIRNESKFTGNQLKKEKAVVSSDGSIAFHFILAAQGLSPIKSVIFANPYELYKMSWEAIIRKGRGFSSIRGYDDSAMMVEWPGFTLPTQGLMENVFYIFACRGNEKPVDLEFTCKDGDLSGGKNPEIQTDEEPLAENLLQADEDIENAPSQTEEKSSDSFTLGDLSKSEAKDGEVKSDKRTDVDFIVENIREYQLDPVYIQDLINKIEALQSEKNVDRKKVSQLNAELDAILKKLRQQ